MGWVFISYAHEDRPKALQVSDFLENSGFSPWIDIRKLYAGQEWELEVSRAIEDADAFIACLSKRSVSKRGHVQAELKKAYRILEKMPEGKVFLIPVLLEKCDPPLAMRHLHWVDYSTSNGRSSLLQGLKLAVDVSRHRAIASEGLQSEADVMESIRRDVRNQIHLVATLMSHESWNCNFPENYLSGNDFEMISTQFTTLASRGQDVLAMFRGSLHFGRHIPLWLPRAYLAPGFYTALAASCQQTHRRPGYRGATIVSFIAETWHRRAAVLDALEVLKMPNSLGSRLLRAAASGDLERFLANEMRAEQPENALLALQAFKDTMRQISGLSNPRDSG